MTSTPAASAATRDELQAGLTDGQLLDGKYRLGPPIGRGGMALVLSAKHLGLDERVAVKVLLPEFRSDPNVVERFLREGRAATKIRSEHVVRMIDVGESGGAPYLVMEYLDGKDLDALLVDDGPQPTAAAVDYILQACEALAEAHTSGMVHRDLKPANLFLTHRADGTPCVKVLDFGISKTGLGVQRVSGFSSRDTLANTIMGSPNYMAPEQMESAAAADARSDIWSLGTILYELLAGRPAFEGTSITEVCAHIMRSPPSPLTQTRDDVPPALEAVILRCLEKDPTRRYADVAELARALEGFGSAAAHGSTLTISRVIGGTGIEPVRRSSQAEIGTWLVARDMIEEKPVAGQRRVGGYFVAAVLVAAAAIAAGGWMKPQLHALLAPEASPQNESPVGALVTVTNAAAPAPAAAASVPPPPPPAASATDAAASLASAASAAPPAPPVAVAPRARRPHRAWHPSVAKDAPLPSFDAPLVPAPEATDPANDNPYATPNAAAAEPLPPPPAPRPEPEGGNPFDTGK